MTKYHLAQFNIARMLKPLDDPQMADFVNALDEINTLADNTEGFVWRLQTDEGDSTAIRVFDDDRLLVNFSVWEDLDSLHQYAYGSEHVKFFRRRKEWFARPRRATLVMWWVEEGYIPPISEAESKLEYIREHGVTPLAFNFKERYTPEEMLAYSAEHGE